ncbi:MAG: glycosyltransferase, partial [Pseudomonadota bacterium]
PNGPRRPRRSLPPGPPNEQRIATIRAFQAREAQSGMQSGMQSGVPGDPPHDTATATAAGGTGGARAEVAGPDATALDRSSAPDPSALAAPPRAPGTAREAAPCAVLLDITRSVKRLRYARATGIDRVERAYLDWAVGRPGGAWLIAALGGRQLLVPPAGAPAVAEALTRLAGTGETPPPADLIALAEPWRNRRRRLGEATLRRHAADAAGGGVAGLMAGLVTATGLSRLPALTAAAERQALASMARRLPEASAYLNVGHDNLSAGLLGALGDAGVRRHVMLHDLIPVTHPEYAEPSAAARFVRRLDAAIEADVLLANSEATARAVRAYARAGGRAVAPPRVLPLGIAAPEAPAEAAPTIRAAPGGAGHFVMLGTIEGRKNHLLMLALWRGLSNVGPEVPVPCLHVVGRRGWAAGQVFDMLDRSPMMGWTVFEHPDLDDAAVAQLMVGARALLFPSFAEGYGLPLSEALAAGVPVIAADLPALRDVGGDVPEWLDPLDGEGWLAAIRDYAAPDSRRRAAQVERLAAWRRPSWEAHFDALEALLAEGCRRSLTGN